MSETSQATDIGPVRSTNEDSMAVIDPGIYIVADGMGGYAAGEVASQLLVATVKHELKGVRSEQITETVLRDVITTANQRILDAAKANPSQSGMGTTATLCCLSKNLCVWAHVGDSRLYLFHAGELTQITRDHSLVADMIAKGEISSQQAHEHPRRNVLTRAVGVDDILAVDHGSFAVSAGDRIVLSTDGLTGVLDDEQILAVMNDSSVVDKANELVQRALQAGGRDNVTVIVSQMVE